MQFDLFDQAQNRILEAPDYRSFRDLLRASNCDRCGLSQSRTNIVVDRGNPDAQVLLVGEAPGENEDRQGLAFVGRAGKLLDQLLADIGMDPDKDVLIANIVKCRPPENRAPKTEEAHTCLPYLRRQIALMQPRLIVLLGATALKHLVREKSDFSMDEEAGKIFRVPEFEDADLMVLFHPAYLLYDPRKTQAMRAHLASMTEHLRRHRIPPFGHPPPL